MSSYLMIFGKPRYLGLLENGEVTFSPGNRVVVESARGEETAVAAGPITHEQAESYRVDLASTGGEGVPRGGEPSFQDLNFIRFATEEDLEARKAQEEEEEQILLKGRELLKSHDLEMKLVDVEFILDRKKLFFYFTAEQRVDFRAYVRDLAREFKTRIELRQIGVRDESKVVKGMAPCGMPCCCSYWLNRFAPICIRMVKEQNLALNPTKISGICGRLMCCMGFEHENYRELWKDLPGPGTKIKAPAANYIVSGVDIARKTVRLFCPGAGEIVVPVSEFQDFRETVMRGETWTGQTVAVSQPVSGSDEITEFPDPGGRRGEDPECSREEIPGAKQEDKKNQGTPREKTGNPQRRRGGPNRKKPVQVSEKKKAEDKKTPGPGDTAAGADKPASGKPDSRKRSRRRRPRKPNSPTSGSNT